MGWGQSAQNLHRTCTWSSNGTVTILIKTYQCDEGVYKDCWVMHTNIKAKYRRARGNHLTALQWGHVSKWSQEKEHGVNRQCVRTICPCSLLHPDTFTCWHKLFMCWKKGLWKTVTTDITLIFSYILITYKLLPITESLTKGKLMPFTKYYS